MIHFVEETGSTNADLAAAIRAGDALPEGHWLIARRQTAGRGRQGREWFDGSGNFMGSTVVALQAGDPPPASLGFVAGLAVHAAVAEALPSTIKPSLKWPNDVLIEGAKLAGILLEMVKDRIVVGIGVTLAKAPDLPDRETAALAYYGVNQPLEAFAKSMEAHFAQQLGCWRGDGLAATLAAFEARSVHSVRAALTVHDSDGSHLEGFFAGLDPSDGALRLRLADGSERVIRAGDII